jgi:hypothetical protein
MLGLTAWLCGNLYEELVVVPNFVCGDPRSSMLAFRVFFHTTNPVFFYIPLGPIILATSILNVVASWRNLPKRRTAILAAVCVLAALLLTAWIVVHINRRLFFGPATDDLVGARALALQWLVWNVVRMGLVVSALVFLRRLASR